MTTTPPPSGRRPGVLARWRQRLTDTHPAVAGDPPPPRGRDGYTLRQRYWAALTGRRLPPKPDRPDQNAATGDQP